MINCETCGGTDPECPECDGDGVSKLCYCCRKRGAVKKGYCRDCDEALAEDAHDARKEDRRS